MAEVIRLHEPGSAASGRDGELVGVQAPPPLALYIHLPWCLKKCPYCDFNSHQQPDDGVPEARYLDALIEDLEQSLPRIWGRPVQTVFLGGGTPSLFSAQAIDELIGAIRARVRLNADAEITMEANPGSFEQARFEGFARAGINRLSLGVQSFDDRFLAGLGRVHDGAAAREAAEMAAQTFASFNLDLMFGLAGQTPDDLARDLATALSFEPPHLSCYQLTIEAGTAFAHHPPDNLPDPDLAGDLSDQVIETVGAAGLSRYEISAFARPGHRSRHNLNYWQFGDYLGIGAGAHSKLSFHDRIVRETRIRHPEQYLKAVASGRAVHQSRSLQRAELPFEFMLNGLRLVDGVPVSLFSERTGLPEAAISAAVRSAHRDGLLTDDPTRFQASETGLAFLNDLQMRFLAD